VNRKQLFERVQACRTGAGKTLGARTSLESAITKKTANLLGQIGGLKADRDFASPLRIDDLGHFEDRQEHADDHAADDNAKDHDKDGFNE
jgi:hypothetical protein